jgi:periplasmic copper chaperone A
MKKLFVALLIGLAACGAPAVNDSPAQAQTAALRIEQPWAAPTPGGVEVSAGYLTIVNTTASADRLVSAASPRAAQVELHKMSMDGGVMRMRTVDELAIPAAGTVRLAPGGLHRMFFGVTQPFVECETIPGRLTFERAGEIDVSLPGRRQAGHQGH